MQPLAVGGSGFDPQDLSKAMEIAPAHPQAGTTLFNAQGMEGSMLAQEGWGDLAQESGDSALLWLNPGTPLQEAQPGEET